MFKTKSQIPIHVQFHTANGKICHVDLQLHHTPVLCWDIIGNKDAQLEQCISQWIDDYAAKKASPIALPISLSHLPPYTTQVLTHLKKIPFGKTITYKELAIATGKPLGARAAGNACGRNPLLLIIPCHRIVASNGQLGGFTSGLDIKKLLLAHEKD